MTEKSDDNNSNNKASDSYFYQAEVPPGDRVLNGDGNNRHRLNRRKPKQRLYLSVGLIICCFLIFLIASFVVMGVVEPNWTSTSPPVPAGDVDIWQTPATLSPTTDTQLAQGAIPVEPKWEWTTLAVDSATGGKFQGVMEGGRFGYSIAVSQTTSQASENHDIRMLAGGSPSSNNNTGHIQIHYFLAEHHDGDNGIPQGDMSEIPKSVLLKGEDPGDQFGSGVALNGNGTIMAVSSIGKHGFAGSVQVFQYDTNSLAWKPMGSPVSGETLTGHCYGRQLALSSDGTILAVSSSQLWVNETLDGFHGADPIDGLVRVYQWQRVSGNQTGDSTMDWNPMGQSLDGRIDSGEECGASLGLSGDGSVLAIGCPLHGNNTGRVMVFEYKVHSREVDNDDNKSNTDELPHGRWIRRGSDILGDTKDDFFGSQLYLLGTGRHLAVGAASGWSRCFELQVEFTQTEVSQDWQQLGGDMKIAPMPSGQYGGSLSLANLKYHVENNGTETAKEGLILVRGFYFFHNWKLNPGFAKIYWIPLADDGDASELNDWSSIGDSLVGREIADRYGIANALTMGGDNRLITAVSADSSLGGYIEMSVGTVL